MTLEENIRKRPAMYIEDGLEALLARLIIDCIELCKTDKIIFEMIIASDNNFSIILSSQYDLNPFLQQFSNENTGFNNYYPNVLKAISKTFEIIKQQDGKIEIHFSIEKSIISDTNVDYLKLSEKVLQIALLNRQIEIITIDKRQKYLIQNYYCFPQGIFYLFDRATKEVLGKTDFMLTFDDKVNANIYQIGIAYRTDWYPTPNIISFANNNRTICGGSLVDGILEGLIIAFKAYRKNNNLIKLKMTRKKFLNGLIVVCAVRGEDYKYEGSFKEILKDDIVKKQVKKIISKLVLDFINNEKEITNKFLWRFDTTNLTSEIF